MNLKKIPGFIWASPVTCIGLIYCCLFWALKWYTWHKASNDALIWQINKNKAPQWLLRLWKKWAGHAIGNVIVLNLTETYLILDEQTTTLHESKHVNQVMRLGVFQPILYLLNMIAIKYGCPGCHPYYDNIFEVDARRFSIKDKINTENYK